MSRETFEATVERIREHVLASGQQTVALVFHGGEPTLIGRARFEAFCRHARARLGDVAELILTVQTNGTRIDAAWAEMLRAQDVYVGVSLDGPREVNDSARVDHKGRGSYDAVIRGIGALREAAVPFAVLTVIQPGADPIATHRHFLGLGSSSVSYMLPFFTHDTIEEVRSRHGRTPCADFLIPVFDDWWENGTPDVAIREFWSIGRVLLGGSSQLDSFGNPPLRYVAIETDGSIQGVDSLRTCEDGMTETRLSVASASFGALVASGGLHARIIAGLPLPTACAGCPEEETCAGGFLPHRYSRARGFDNPSVWCADLLALFGHIRERLGIDRAETARRREALAGADRAGGPEVFDPFTIAAL